MFGKNFFGIFVVSTFAISFAHADPKDFYFRRYLDQKFSSLPSPAVTTQAGVFNQKLNHDDGSDSRTFKQNYFINNSAVKKGEESTAPVLLMICGEATCTESNLGGAMAVQAKKLHAHQIALEHRYYGTSQPFPTLTTENLKYLSTPQAIEDLAEFQRYAMDTLGLKGPWIVMGGSYAGSLAAYYRLKHPELVVGALSSSGPVRAEANFESCDLTVANGAGKVCAEKMREVVKQVESKLDNPKALSKLKTLFGAKEVNDPVDFMYVIADMGAIAIQYGFRDTFCDELIKSSDPVEGYASAGKRMLKAFGITALQDSFQGAESLDPNDYLGTFGLRQWMYQSCTEYGYWQVAYHDPAVSVRSSLITREYHDKVCDRLFGIKTPVDVTRSNHEFYEPLIDVKSGASQILFTNGSADPWTTLSISDTLGNHTNLMTDTYLIEGAAHADDLGTPRSTDRKELKQSRDLWMSLAQKWLEK